MLSAFSQCELRHILAVAFTIWLPGLRGIGRCRSITNKFTTKLTKSYQDKKGVNLRALRELRGEN
jgi:hypothetical protein